MTEIGKTDTERWWALSLSPPVLELFPQPSESLIGKHLITQPDVDPNIVALT
jgi:hypothetical protein